MAEPTLCVDRLPPTMGALITGIDLRGEGSTTRRKRLYALLLEPLGLFLPDQGLTPATLLAFATTFGALATPHHVSLRAGLRAPGVAGK